MGTVLEAEGLLVGYAGAPVCGEVSASVDAGEVLGIVGVNGAGKSTVARTIAGRQASLAGDVKVHGLLIDPDAVPFRRQVSAVFDDDLFFPSLTVREHLLLIARGHSLDDPEARVEEELEFFGLQGRAHAIPDALSSGQRRRLLLAAGLIRPSSLLILDEPEQRLDPRMRVAIGERIADHAKDGGAVVLVTHDPQLLLATASTCLVIDEEVREFDPEQGASIIAGS
ncbi:ABC transporter ATP-binding protein [Paenarthrobacter nitroguajacolicus]|uniref:ABC transporter ATP-binding protein n=1 Tax=Paenarthrobacter nitroguajacolicus TaxID=211146 RepID=UPI0015BEE1FD|nr:ABC transporter ATP-binding protein [Paenarthrobacter nitroguajacolicus]NWL11572.1 ABC transporter ATP-binding protein [Paenarthrobacter nitroguajacolicus]NWL33814.1 ABC transporter ATP-binding protein [Paenarthrobacter nitroguajacolicus]